MAYHEPAVIEISRNSINTWITIPLQVTLPHCEGPRVSNAVSLSIIALISRSLHHLSVQDSCVYGVERGYHLSTHPNNPSYMTLLKVCLEGMCKFLAMGVAIC